MSMLKLAYGKGTATRLLLLKKRNVSGLVLLSLNIHLLYISLEIGNYMAKSHWLVGTKKAVCVLFRNFVIIQS